MKLRLTGKGFTNFTGQMGVNNFTDGLSDNEVHPAEALRIANVMGAEWEDGSSANTAQLYQESLHIEVDTSRHSIDVVPATQTENEAEATVVLPVAFTRNELELIADTDGIAGLREIGNKLGIKSNSIVGMIDAIMEKTGNSGAE